MYIFIYIRLVAVYGVAVCCRVTTCKSTCSGDIHLPISVLLLHRVAACRIAVRCSLTSAMRDSGLGCS